MTKKDERFGENHASLAPFANSRLKTNPPYPPLSGGYKKAMRPRRAEGVLLFLAPLTRGGRGG